MKKINHDDSGIRGGRTVTRVKGWPVLGNSVAAARNPLAFLIKLRRGSEDIAAVMVAGRKYIVLQSPGACRHVLQENAKNYYKPGLAKLMKKFMGEGLATSNGAWWLRQRRLLQPAFHRTKIEGLIATARDESALLLQAWHQKDLQQPIDITAAMLELTLGNIAKAMFGKDIKKEYPGMYHIINEMLSAAASAASARVKIPFFIPTPANTRLLRAAGKFNTIIDEMVEQRLHSNGVSADLFDLLLQAYGNGTESGMSRQRLKEEILTIFITGHETTAQTLSWVLYQLALYPKVYSKMREEISHVRVSDIITMDTLQQLPYTKAIIEETMRIYPPVWLIARKSIAEDIIADYKIPAGSTVLLNIYGMNNYPAYWASPADFIPERFIKQDGLQVDPFLYLPFGGGQRLCIGHSFAMMVMQLVLLSVVKEFSFSLLPGIQPVPLPGITLRAKEGIHLLVSPFVQS